MRLNGGRNEKRKQGPQPSAPGTYIKGKEMSRGHVRGDGSIETSKKKKNDTQKNIREESSTYTNQNKKRSTPQRKKTGGNHGGRVRGNAKETHVTKNRRSLIKSLGKKTERSQRSVENEVKQTKEPWQGQRGKGEQIHA